jgi:hypothetical protein
MLSMVIYVYWCLTRLIYHMMFVSTTATYKTSNIFLPLQSTRVHIIAQQCHTSIHHRSAMSHEFTSSLSRVTRVHITAQPCHTSSHNRSAMSHEFTSSLSRVRVNQSLIICVVFGRQLSFCHFCFGHDSCCPWNSIF